MMGKVFTKQMDKAGRIIVPKEIRKLLKIEENDYITFEVVSVEKIS